MTGSTTVPGGQASPQVLAAVLAGGRSRRMGEDKRRLSVDGTPLLERAVAAVTGIAPVLVVVGRTPSPVAASVDPPVAVVVDDHPGEGPLGGLVTALRVADDVADGVHVEGLPPGEVDVVLVVAGDHPDLVPAVLLALTEHLASTPSADAVLLGDPDGAVQPLIGAYRRRVHPRLRAAFAAGERRAGAVRDHLDVEVLPFERWRAHDPAATTAVDLDTPDDLRRRGERGTADDEAARSRGADGPARVPAPRRLPVWRLRRSPDGVGARADEDAVATEEPLRLLAAGPGAPPVDVVTTMRTPGHDADLAVGWLFTEGLYDPAAGVAEVAFGDPLLLSRPEDTVTVRLPHRLDLDVGARRFAAATASCGVCGRASIDELAARCTPQSPADSAGALSAAVLLELPSRLRAAQSLFATTGGVHATGLFSFAGEPQVVREDIGRHNALDAAIGARVRAGERDFGRLVAVLSGRVGFELVAKAAAAGIPVLVAVGAPTDLAVRTADRLGITLAGFVRDGRGNLHTHRARVRT
ncbi:formate dehydrogenase accessory sulfurtransferase FdhD [Egicoccus halophilus]|uniref:Multifunctional fusion protein n=1 Tax=Egicoccus halophilus TaxID=1670830 RepID=A0A8J3EWG7_9ACTN|nr:formate dehydrogenase accessory sulfurtransferase FdhD [Egicoccus halophilus]GGI03625.1 hypothetical protein GCM10011354_04970 [Egicoccus halophilus]